VAAFYVAALVRTQAFAGLAQGLFIIKELLSAKDYQAYPQLDSNDSILERWYTIVALSAQFKRDGDLLRIIEGIRSLVLLKTGTTSFCFRDILAAKNKSGGADIASLERMKAEWRGIASDDRKLVADAVKESTLHAQEIERLLIEQTPESITPSGGGRPFQVLIDELRGIADFLGEEVSAKLPEASPSLAVTADAKASLPAGIHSRADALRALHEVAEFFRKTEPASPVPYFLQRAARLVDKDFLGLLDELAPDAVPVFQNLAGVNKADS
jgi:type VI secretion system protein ImpA